MKAWCFVPIFATTVEKCGESSRNILSKLRKIIIYNTFEEKFSQLVRKFWDFLLKIFDQIQENYVLTNFKRKFSNFLKRNDEYFELNFATIVEKCGENPEKIFSKQRKVVLFIIVLQKFFPLR